MNGTGMSFYQGNANIIHDDIGAGKALKSMRDELQRFKDENKELKDQIDFLKQFKE